MREQPDVIRDAQQLLDSLYLSGDLSVDRHESIAAGLREAAACRAASSE